MINHVYNDLFYKGSTDKQWKIKYSNGVIGNAGELFSESIELSESLCSEPELTFGCCEASVFRFKVANIFTSLKDEWLDVSVIVDGNEDNPLVVGRYKVKSDNVTADRQWKDVVAYDAMHDIVNADVSDWYNSILPTDNSTVTMRQFRKSFVENFGLKEADIYLVNDDMVVGKTISIQTEEEGENEDAILEEAALSGKDVITAICEINGCFGHIGRDGFFHYIYLPQDIQGLYPADFLFPGNVPEEYSYLSQSESGALYPQDAKGFKIDISNYITCEYEDYHVNGIDRLQIRQEENDIGKIWPEGEKKPDDNCYIINGNFLVYGKSSSELRLIAKNIYEKIQRIVYRPFLADCAGNLCLEVGDAIRISTSRMPVESYILKRTMKGIQALRDDYSATGSELRPKGVNSVHNSIEQLKGKANVLSRTIEETKSTLIDADEKMQTQITQNAKSISLEAERAGEAEETLSGRITVEADRITSEVKRASDAEGELSSSIVQTANNIVLKVDSNGNLAEVALGVDADDPSSTRFLVNAKNIELSADEAMNLLAGGTLNLSGKNINIESENFSVDKSGNVVASSIEINGGTVNLDTVNSPENLIILRNIEYDIRDTNGNEVSIDFFGEGNPTKEDVFVHGNGSVYLNIENCKVYECYIHGSFTIELKEINLSRAHITKKETGVNTETGLYAHKTLLRRGSSSLRESSVSVSPEEITITKDMEGDVIKNEVSIIPYFSHGKDGSDMEVGIHIDGALLLPELQFETAKDTTPAMFPVEIHGSNYIRVRPGYADDDSIGISAGAVDTNHLIVNGKELVNGSMVWENQTESNYKPNMTIPAPGIAIDMPITLCNGDADAQPKMFVHEERIVPSTESISFSLNFVQAGSFRVSYSYWKNID